MTRKRLRSLFRPRGAVAACLCLLAGACAGGHGVEATAVLEYDQCQGLQPGLTRVDYAAVAGLRGGRLLSMPDTGETAAEPPAASRDALMVAISRGPQPTPGYGLSLEGAIREGDTAIISVHWKTPQPDAVLAQVITHPCLVVALPGGVFREVDVVDQTGETIASLTL